MRTRWSASWRGGDVTGEDRYVRSDGAAAPPEGVRELEHTADVGIEVSAASWPELLRRAAEGTWYLVFGERHSVGEPEPGDEDEEAHDLHLEADGAEFLLLKWLQELLFLHEVDGFVARRVRFVTLSERELDALVWGGPPRRDPVRDLKGVTYHALSAKREAGGWMARVIFDI